MQEHLPLWNKIQSFSIDNGTAVVPFSAKLAASQNWSIEFTQRAIEEYKRFILLCCISEKGAAPSQTVDEVWHLHLTYTQSYWIDFCRNTLGKDIHHHPSTGGDQENHRHREWYKETLQLYRTVFGVDPPSDIWPAPSDWPVPEDPRIVWHRKHILILAALLLFPFLFIALVYHTWLPFTLGGPHFLVFFPLYGISLLLGYILHRRLVKKEIMQIAADYLPADVTAFQVADLLYGKHRALQAGIVDLINRNLLEVTGNNFFLVKKAWYTSTPEDKNPLMSAYDAAPAGSPQTYDMMMMNWYDREKFSHPALQALDKFIQRPESFARAYLFHLAFFVMLLARTVQATANQRSFALLWLEGAGLLILFFLAARVFSKRSVIAEVAKERMQGLAGGNDEMVHKFAINGMTAINEWSQAALLTGIFAASTQSDGWTSSGDGGSDSGGSSCGGGGSCGGGSGCGGCSGSN